MKIQTFLLIVMLTLVLPVLANAQSGADESTIRHVVQYYFDGWKNNDVESMKKAFHPKAKWFFQSDKYDLREVPISQVYANTRETARQKSSESKPVVGRIVSIDITGEAATVKVEIDYPTAYVGVNVDLRTAPRGARQTEYLSLIKFPEGWRIIGKVGSIQSTHVAQR